MKPSSKKLQVFLPLILSVVLALGMFIGFKLRDTYRVPHHGVSLFLSRPGSIDAILQLVKTRYVDSVNDSLLKNAAISAILQHLDPHSVYIPPQELPDVNAELAANFGGVGIEYMLWHDTLLVLHVIPGTPAAQAGIQPGDAFLQANQQPLTDHSLSIDQIQDLLRGPVGSSLLLLIKRPGKVQPIRVSLKRGAIPTSSVEAAFLINAHTGYVRLSVFGADTYPDWKHAVDSLKQRGMQQLILDLCDNPGGYMDAALHIADECLPGRKLMLYTEGLHYPREDYYSSDGGIFDKGPLAVLVNENSASASEILAGILQDWDRATIVGRRTFGKGLVQEQYTLPNGGAIRLTVARYYLPSGRCIQKPYAQDTSFDAYDEDIWHRYTDGEMFSRDSIHLRDTTPYFTQIRKRIVYAESGITPDIFVPLDSAMIQPFIAHAYHLGLFQYFALQYYLTHKASIDAYLNWQKFAEGFHWHDNDYTQFLRMCAHEGLAAPRGFNEHDKNYVLAELKANLARIVWGIEGYDAVRALNSAAVQKALQLMPSKP
ncbi:MAG: S41 family peptidase [Thermoflavifilum sp.]|nr:S41 family peptidase [Thermoflavifilum sp.]